MKVVTNIIVAMRVAKFWMFLLRTNKRHLSCLAVMAHIVSSERRILTIKMENRLLFWKNVSANQNQPQRKLCQKSQKSFHLKHDRVVSPLVETVNRNFISFLIFYTFSRLWYNIILSVSNDGVGRSLEFGQDSVTLTVRDVVEEKTISSQEITLAAWSLFLPDREDFLNNHIARILITPTSKGLRRCGRNYFQLKALKSWTREGIGCPIWRTLSQVLGGSWLEHGYILPASQKCSFFSLIFHFFKYEFIGW